MQEEIVKALLTLVTLVVGYVLYRIKLRQPKVTYFQSGFTSFLFKPELPALPFVIWMGQIIIQNTGRAPARNVRVAHFFMPLHWQVIQTIDYRTEQVNGQDRIIVFETLEPGMVVIIAYMDVDYDRLTGAHDHVRSEEGIIRPTPVQLQRVLPKSVQYSLAVLAILGLYTVISLLYIASSFAIKATGFVF